MGAGHTVTAFYEVIPVGAPDAKNEVDASKYSLPASPAGGHDELLTVKLRYQPPQGGKSTLIETPLKADAVKKFSAASPDFTFATSVAAAGLVLRHSQFQGGASLDAVLEWLTIPEVVGNQPDRQEFRKLIEMAKQRLPMPAK
jgi:Ca-activated chloride channel family protein